MTPAGRLLINDATWLTPPPGSQLLHESIATNIAERLGPQSLRYHHTVRPGQFFCWGRWVM